MIADPNVAQATADALPAYDISRLGQVFTPDEVVRAMLCLRQNTGRVLEPSCGNGAFSKQIPGCVAMDCDASHAPAGSLIFDFFAYSLAEKFATIIGNPPYVRYQDIRPETKRLLCSTRFDQRSNLYLFFIEKAIAHLAYGGELIFITPRDFLKATASVRLNRWLATQGTITHALELGDARVFAGAVPNCLIWRFQKDCFHRVTQYAQISHKDRLDLALKSPQWVSRHFKEIAGHIYFAQDGCDLLLRDIARVKVGAVSGADDLFANEHHGNRDFVCAHTVKTGQTRRMIWAQAQDGPPEVLRPYKQRLLARGIRHFDESNWWHWGRGYPQTDAPRVYVNGKTRHPRPFFVHPCRHFDGAVLGLFPHDPSMDLAAFCDALNGLDWAGMGFQCDGRFLFSQRSLESAPLPASLKRFLPRSGSTNLNTGISENLVPVVSG